MKSNKTKAELILELETLRSRIAELEEFEPVRKRAEEALRASLDRYRSYIDVTGQLGWTTNADGEVVDDIPSFRKFTGQTYDEVKGWGWINALHPDDVEHTEEVWKKAVISKTPYEIEYRIRRHDGIYRHFMARGIPVFEEEGGRIREWVGTCIDITERKRAEESLRESRNDLNRAQAVARIGSWRLDIRKNKLLWSEETHRIFGIPDGTPLTYDTFLATVHPADREYVDEKWHAALRGEPYDIEHRIVVEGNIKWVREKADLEFDCEGKVIGAFGTVQDITERKQVAQALEKSLSLLNATLESTADGILVTDIEGNIQNFNRKFLKMWGIPETIAKSKDDYEIRRWILNQLKHPEKAFQTAERAYEDQDREGFTVVELKDGRVFEMYWCPQKIDGQTVGAVTSVRDITERERAEETLRESEARYRRLSENLEETVKKQVAELRQAQTLAALGQMVSVVAHEIRNPLQNINLGIDSLRKAVEQVSDQSDIAEIIEEIAYGSMLLNSIINELLYYARPVTLELLWCPIGDIVKKALNLTGNRLKNVTVDQDIDQSEIFVDEAKMTRVLVNLLLNASDAMPEGGNLKISAQCSETEGPSILRLRVSDTGCGMREEVLQKIYEPFFTTKIRGAGLGVPICKKIVEAHNGTLSIKSRKNEGTTVEITLPLCN